MTDKQAKMALSLVEQIIYAAQVANEIGKMGQAEQLFDRGLNLLTQITEEIT